MVHTVERMASEVFIPLTVGGGIRKLEDIRTMLNAGADKVSINTAAVFEPEFVGRAADRFGSQCIVVAIDAKKSLALASRIAGKSSPMVVANPRA